MRIPRQEDISLLLMSECARNWQGRRLTLTDIARYHGLSVLFLKKLARKLRQAGLLESKEGFGGGYSLSRDPERISVWDVMQAFEDTDHAVPAALRGRGSCPIHAACLPQSIRRTVSEAVRERLSRVTIKELIGTVTI